MTDFRNISFKIITAVFRNNSFSDELLHSFTKDVDERAKKNIYRIVKGSIKNKKMLDFIISSHTKKSTKLKLKCLFYPAIYELKYMDSIPDYATVNEYTKIAKKIFGKKVSKFFHAILRNFLRNKEIKLPENFIKKTAIEYSFNENLVSKWINIFGNEKTIELCKYFNENPKLTLRINSTKTDSNEILEYFKDIEITQSEFSENILTTYDKSILFDEKFELGFYSIQDNSAALVIEFLDPQKDEIILDMFAAPGGKTTYIAEKLENTGKIIAIDLYSKKVKMIQENASRLNLKNIQTCVGNSLEMEFKEKFDRILLDVPCSGWGVFQKKAELRWQQNNNLKELLKIQKEALSKAAKLIKKDGIIVYSTCTMNPKENDRQIEWFLKNFTEFGLLEPKLDKRLLDNKFLKPFPPRDKMDGSFAAKLIKLR